MMKLKLTRGHVVLMVVIGILIIAAYCYSLTIDPRASNTTEAALVLLDKLESSASYIFAGRIMREIGTSSLPEQEYQYAVEIIPNPFSSKGEVEGVVIVSSAQPLVNFSKLSPHSPPPPAVFYTRYNKKHNWHAVIGIKEFEI